MSKYFGFNPIQLFRIDLLGAAHRFGGGGGVSLPKNCHKYPRMMKHGTFMPTSYDYKEIIYKYKNHVTHTLTWCPHRTSGLYPPLELIPLPAAAQFGLQIWSKISQKV